MFYVLHTARPKAQGLSAHDIEYQARIGERFILKANFPSHFKPPKFHLTFFTKYCSSVSSSPQIEVLRDHSFNANARRIQFAADPTLPSAVDNISQLYVVLNRLSCIVEGRRSLTIRPSSHHVAIVDLLRLLFAVVMDRSKT